MAKSMLTWLATREYWTRVWVMQEVALSDKDPICLFGQHRIPLLSLDSVLLNWRDGGFMPLTNWGEGSLKPKEKSSVVVKLPPDVSDGITRAREVCMLRDELWSFRPSKRLPLDLARSAQMASHRRTSNAHDYIYGLRGLLSMEDQERMPVDYGLSIPELYASVTKAILRSEDSAALLGAAVGIGQENTYGLASWALDFSRPVRLPALRDKDSNDGCESSPEHPSSDIRVLSTNGSYLGSYVVATHPQELTANDIVDELGSVYSKEELASVWSTGGQQAFEARATRMLCQLLGVDAGAGAGAEPKPDILPFLELLTAPFYKTSLKEGKLRGTPVELPLDEALHELGNTTDSSPLSVRLLQLSIEALRDSATMTEQVFADLQTQLREIKKRRLSLYHTQVLLLFQYRQRGFRGENGMLFRTDKGQIGKCRGNVEPEDEIWALPGSKTAFVLRPVSGVHSHSLGPDTQKNARYQLVGPCICDGLVVDGEGASDYTAQRIDII
ncbi:hypothetical protein PG984_004562 [Apiospora sp. TS-2023a]